MRAPTRSNGSGGGVNYLAIGNSITVHGFADYWWDDDRGMAASSDGRDYVHLISEHLEETGGPVMARAYNFSAWEMNAHDRAEFLGLLDPYLSGGLDLVTIQLGENASDLSTWEADFEELVSYVKGRAPRAEVVVIGDFWSNGARDDEKRRAAEAQSVTYVDLEGVRDKPEYMAGLGAEVEGADGELHVIDHDGVAGHPGDAGMRAIADRVIGAI